MFLLIPFLILTLALFLLSFFWFDHGLMWMLSISKPIINNVSVLREFRFENRNLMADLLVVIIILLTVIQIILFISKRYKFFGKKHIIVLLTISLIASLAYPLLSKDIFSYMFGAKILFHYKENPYLVAPIEFQAVDMQLSFTHWLTAKYVYGPIYLLISAIPIVVFGGDKFVANYLGVKLINLVCFVVSGWFILKITKDKRAYVYWFLNPLLILEYLVNSHNDLVMAAIFFGSVYAWKMKKKVWGGLLFVFSVLTKFISGIFLPFYFIKEKYWEDFFKIALLVILAGFTIRGGQLWYFSWIFMALPLAKLKNASLVLIFLFSLHLIIIKYYGFVVSDSWGREGNYDKFSWIIWGLTPMLVYIEYKDRFLKTLKKKAAVSVNGQT